MAASLRRILKFRKLTEEQVRLQLEQAVQLLRQATTARERSLVAERHQRSVLAESWTPGARHSPAMDATGNTADSGDPTADQDAWLLEKAALEFSSLQRIRLKEIEEGETRRVEPLIEQYKEQRRELRQTELLLEKQNSIQNIEKDHRMQAETDEWFLQRGLADRRQAKRREYFLDKTGISSDETS